MVVAADSKLLADHASQGPDRQPAKHQDEEGQICGTETRRAIGSMVAIMATRCDSPGHTPGFRPGLMLR